MVDLGDEGGEGEVSVGGLGALKESLEQQEQRRVLQHDELMARFGMMLDMLGKGVQETANMRQETANMRQDLQKLSSSVLSTAASSTVASAPPQAEDHSSATAVSNPVPEVSNPDASTASAPPATVPHFHLPNTGGTHDLLRIQHTKTQRYLLKGGKK